MSERIKKYIYSPAGKTFAFFMSVILSGIICGWFISEITINGKIVWRFCYRTISFYVLVFYLLIIYLYNRYIYIQEKKILNFLDDDYCKAYIRSECMPELIKKYKKSIQENNIPNDLSDIHKELKKILKNENLFS